MWSVHRGDQLTACHGRLEHHSLRSNSIVVPFYFPDNILQTLRKVLVKLWQKHNNTWMRCRKETSTNKSSCYKDILIKSYLRPSVTEGFGERKNAFQLLIREILGLHCDTPKCLHLSSATQPWRETVQPQIPAIQKTKISEVIHRVQGVADYIHVLPGSHLRSTIATETRLPYPLYSTQLTSVATGNCSTFQHFRFWKLAHSHEKYKIENLEGMVLGGKKKFRCWKGTKEILSTMAPLNPHPIIIVMGFKVQLIAIDSVMGKG